MAKSNTPGNASWKEVSENLRGLQDRISSHQGRFRDAGRNDTAEDLEKCIQLLHGAQMVAMDFDSSSLATCPLRTKPSAQATRERAWIINLNDCSQGHDSPRFRWHRLEPIRR
jgi:hypothetical protein